jgi:hypothetical protein
LLATGFVSKVASLTLTEETVHFGFRLYKPERVDVNADRIRTSPVTSGRGVMK